MPKQEATTQHSTRFVSKQSATSFQLTCQKIYFSLHSSCSLEKLTNFVPICIPQIAVRHRQFVNFPKRNLKVQIIF